MTEPFDPTTARVLADALGAAFERIYSASRPMPRAVPEVAAIPDAGVGLAGAPALWRTIVDGGAKLASPWMIGHMDSAPHPVAALTDAVVSALNNNLLFRELSPFASRVEEALIGDFSRRLGLPGDTPGIFASGGSLANLTALFAAVGGYAESPPRDRVLLAVPASGHTSLAKAAAILGLPADHLARVETDEAGRMRPAALEAVLGASALPHKIVVAVLGGTVTGAVDDLGAVAEVARRHDAWLHVDAVYGGALAFSRRHRHFLRGIEAARSIALGPQKWLYTPRLSALTLFPKLADFDARLGVAMPYSAGGEANRGTWGLQGSRRADAVTLWALLSVIGADGLAEMIDGSIDLAARFHRLLSDHPATDPVHRPDLNLQAFRLGAADRGGERLLAVQRELAARGKAWVSVSGWRGEFVLRAVLLSPATTEAHLGELTGQLAELG